MTRIVRTVDAGTLATIAEDHTQPFHLVRIVFPAEVVYLSEGPQVTFGGNVYREGWVKVSNLTWTGEGVQTCTLDILNDTNYAATLFLQNKMADAEITIWINYRKADGTFTTPVLYVVGSVEDSLLERDLMTLTVVSSASRVKFFPNVYMGAAGFNHIPAEGVVVFWNATTYVLERDYS